MNSYTPSNYITIIGYITQRGKGSLVALTDISVSRGLNSNIAFRHLLIDEADCISTDVLCTNDR